MLWIVEKRLRNASSGTDGIEVNDGAVTLHLNDGFIIAKSEELPEGTHPSRPLFHLQPQELEGRASVIATIVPSYLTH